MLGRLNAFVPQLAAANAALASAIATRGPAEFDVEQLAAEDAPHVEMELACGVLELRDAAAQQAAERALAGGALVQADGSSSDSESSDESDSDNEAACDNTTAGDNAVRPQQAAPQQKQTQKRARIEVLPPQQQP